MDFEFQRIVKRISEAGVFPSLDCVSGTLCLLLSHYVTRDISLEQFKRLLKTLWFVRCIVTFAFLCCVQIFLLTYLLT